MIFVDGLSDGIMLYAGPVQIPVVADCRTCKIEDAPAFLKVILRKLRMAVDELSEKSLRA